MSHVCPAVFSFDGYFPTARYTHDANKLNMVDAAELKAYINRIVDDMDKAQLAAMEKAPLGYAAKIRDKIETLLEAHYREIFEKWLETERVV